MNRLPLPRTFSAPFFAFLAGALAVMPTGVASAASRSQKGELLVYFGTYTGKKSKGIYVSRLDLASGKLSTPELAAEVTSPSFLAVHPKRDYLYTVNEVSKFDGKTAGSVSAFSIESATGRLVPLNQESAGGAGPCHLIVDEAGKNVLVANYGGGSIAVLPLRKDGGLQAASSFIQHAGSSADKRRQEAPHAHGIYLDPA